MQLSGKDLLQLFRDAKKSGEKSAKHFEEEDIHKWRVAVKKIKADFLFFQFFNPDLSDEELRPLKKIFGTAGKIRELQLLEETVRKFRTSEGAGTKKKLLHDLFNKEKKAREKFQKHFKERGTEVLKRLEEVMGVAEKKVSVNQVSGYFRQKIDEILQQIQRENLAEQEYHELRKELKELKYNLSFADKNSKEIVFTAFSEKALAQLEKSLGDWHDQIIIVERLTRFSSSPVIDENVHRFITELIRHSQGAAERILLKIKKQFNRKA